MSLKKISCISIKKRNLIVLFGFPSCGERQFPKENFKTFLIQIVIFKTKENRLKTEIDTQKLRNKFFF